MEKKVTCKNKSIFKTGSPFVRKYFIELVDRVTSEREALDLTNVVLESKSVLNGLPFINFTITKLDQSSSKGYFLLTYDGDTSNWALGTLKYDITINGKHSCTDTITIDKGIT